MKERKKINNLNLKRIFISECDKSKLDAFNAGPGFENFSEYIISEAFDDLKSGDGSTHILINEVGTDYDIVGYFTLSCNALPYDDGYGSDSIPGIPVVEIKMFAIDIKYQDVFYQFEDEILPISVWCLDYLSSYVANTLSQHISCKALYLHAVDSAEEFYYINGFNYMKPFMKPLYSVDDDFKAMWKPLKKFFLPEG